MMSGEQDHKECAKSCECRLIPNGEPLLKPLNSPDDESRNSAVNKHQNPLEEEDKNQSYVSVASFNLLAPVYVRPYDKRTGGIQPFAAFDWISEKDSPEVLLDIENHRGPRLLSSLQKCLADVICLQELQMEATDNNRDDNNKESPLFELPSWLLPITEAYQVHLPPETEMEIIAKRNLRVLDQKVAVVCAILIKKDLSFDAMREKDNNTCVSVSLRLPTMSDNKNTVEETEIVITSVHLDAKDETKRVGQLTKCLDRVRDFVSKKKTRKTTTMMPSTIVAGDMNQEFLMGSCCRAFLVEQAAPTLSDIEGECASALRLPKGQAPNTEQMQEWKTLHANVKQTVRDACIPLDRVDTGATRSAYDLSDIADNASSATNNNNKIMGQWRLDHILYSSMTLEPCVNWSTLEDDAESCEIGLPNHKCGSDHLPVGAVFKVVLPVPQLSTQEQDELSNQLQGLLSRQRQEMTTRQTELDSELAELEAKILSIPGSDAESSAHGDDITVEDDALNTKKAKQKKKKRQNKGPPPKEIMDFMRQKRGIVQELKERHKLERGAMVQDLDDLRRLFIEQQFGYNASQWVERG